MVDGTTSSEYSCPVCTRVLEEEIFQCSKGHLICPSCAIILRICPQCKKPFEKRNIRVSVIKHSSVEQMLHCPNTSFGCKDRVLKENSSTHRQICSFREVSVEMCKHMGHSCDYVTTSRNVAEAITHFQEAHGVVKYDSAVATRKVAGFLSGESAPFILEKKGREFLIFAKMGDAKQAVSLNCVHLTNLVDTWGKFKVKFTISTGQEFLQYRYTPVVLGNVEEALLQPCVELSVDKLEQKCLVYDNLEVEDSDKTIQVEHGKLKKTGSAWLRRPCRTCKLAINWDYYCCLCHGYAFCKPCGKEGYNLDHLLIQISNPTERLTLCMSGWNYCDTLKSRRTGKRLQNYKPITHLRDIL